MTPITYDQVRAACAALGYKFFAGGPFDLNLFGVRGANRDFGRDAFDDTLGAAFLDERGAKQIRLWPATTDPGYTHIHNPQFAEAIARGTAFVAAGQYPRAYHEGFHGTGAFRHKALVQVGEIAVHRVQSRAANIWNLESYPVQSSRYWGVNIHRAQGWGVTENVGLYSAGCQVFQRAGDLDELLALCFLQEKNGFGSWFTYTLFNEQDFIAL